MMISVKLELGALSALNPQIVGAVLDQVLMGLAESGRAKWTKLAQQQLKTTRLAYVSGIQNAVLERPGTAVIELVGQLANMLERGATSFDIKAGLFAGPGVKTSLDGFRYRAVPFRHAVPGSGFSAGIPMDQTFSQPGAGSTSGRQGMKRGDAAMLGATAYAIAKRLKPGQRINVKDFAKLQEKHVTDPFRGMARIRGSKAMGAQTRYMTWRMASEKSPDAWIHPGLAPLNLAGQVAEYVARIAPRAFTAAAKGLMGQTAPPTGGGET